MKAIKEIIKLVLTLILSILIILALLINVAQSTILRKEYVLEKLQKCNYYETMYQEILSTFDNYILQSGLEEEALKDICTQQQIKEDTLIIINNIYDGADNEINTKIIEDKLQANIDKQLETTIVTESTRQAIKQLVNTIVKEYEGKIFQTQFNQKINKFITNIGTKIDLIEKITYIAIAIILVILVAINIKEQKSRILSWIGISMTISGTVVAIINIFINSQITIGNITLLSEAFSTLIRIVMNDILINLLTIGIGIIIIGIVLIVAGNFIGENTRKKAKTS